MPALPLEEKTTLTEPPEVKVSVVAAMPGYVVQEGLVLKIRAYHGRAGVRVRGTEQRVGTLGCGVHGVGLGHGDRAA